MSKTNPTKANTSPRKGEGKAAEEVFVVHPIALHTMTASPEESAKAKKQLAEREAKWAEEDRIYEEKQAAKAQKKLEKERKRKLRALRKLEKKAQKERKLFERYLEKERARAEKAAQKAARKAQKEEGLLVN